MTQGRYNYLSLVELNEAVATERVLRVTRHVLRLAEHLQTDGARQVLLDAVHPAADRLQRFERGGAW